MKIRCCCILFGLLLLIAPAFAQEAATVTITADMLNAAPERFGANVYPTPLVDMNMWVQDGTEPTITRLPGTATGGGANFILNEADPKTDYWETLGEGFFNGGRVRVYRAEGDTVRLVRDSAISAYHTGGAAGYRIELADNGEAVQAGDSYIVERLHQDAPNALANPRMDFVKRNELWIPFTAEWTGVPANVTVTRDTDAVVGLGSLKVVSQESIEAGIQQYNVYPLDESTTVFDPNATYTVDVWLKQTGIPDGKVHVWFGQYPQVSQQFTVNGDWAQYSFTFSGLQPLPAESSTNTVSISFSGKGTLWVDNPRIYDSSAAPYALMPAAKQALMDYHPGTIRIWSGHTNVALGQTLDSWLAEPGAALNHYDVGIGIISSTPFSLPEALKLTQEVGGTPWLIVSPAFSEQEWQNLIEYLSGSVDTPYGALRAARGQPTPWTDVFDHIRIELGNETWNGIFVWTYGWDGSLGRFANHFYSAAQAAPDFNAEVINFVIGGFVMTPDAEYGYGQQALHSARQSAYMGVTAYVGGWDSVDVSGGDVEAKYRNLLTFTPQIFGVLSANQSATRAQLAQQGIAYTLATYEGGPGYALPDPQFPFDAAAERLGKSLASATTTLEAFLYNTSLGYGPQSFFSFAPGANWTSHTTFSNGYRAHVPWLALQLRNQHCSGAMVTAQVSGAPTVDLPAITGDSPFPAVNDLPLVASYAFQDASRTCVFVLSRSLDQAIPVSLNVADVPGGAAMLYKLTGDPRSSNVDAQTIGVQSESLAALNGYTFTLPPGSIYLFESSAG